MAHLAVERQLADEYRPVEVAERLLRRDQDADRDRKVVGRAFLTQVGRGEVDRDAAEREGEPGVLDRGADTVSCLLDGCVSKPDDGEPADAIRDIDLNLDQFAFEADHGAGPYLGHSHRASLLSLVGCRPG